MEKIKQEIKRQIKSSQLAESDKIFLDNYLDALNDDQLKFLAEEINKNPKVWVELIGNIQKQKQILFSGTDKQWEEIF
ncbi:MAG: hypothetical protein V1698_00755 [bacterium]